ncbi:MAG: 50S ribosomal protein L3 [Candidatus Altiarchaeota archaeon]|nr:50S ribosomal protein L3 [Candidatus Altiarchaeota archaeon]
MATPGRPRRGSLQFVPRKRAKKEIPRVRSWPAGQGLLGFLGYKVGIATALVKVTNSESRLAGHIVSVPVTLIETPEMTLESLKFYKRTIYGKKTIGETTKPEQVQELADSSDFARAMLASHPEKAGFPKKNPDLIEVAIGGNAQDAIPFKDRLGKEIDISEFFNQAELVDVLAVTRGLGFQGVVKRYGVKLLASKAEKSRRKVGSLGPEGPGRTRWSVPMAGQHGYHARTEFNKEILALSDPDKLNPKSGWHKYGLVKSKCVLISGTIPGPIKRAIVLRKPIRPKRIFYPSSLEKIVFKHGEVISL